jgi:hypothetical protein
MKHVIKDCYCGGALDLSVSFSHLTEKESEENILLTIFYTMYALPRSTGLSKKMGYKIDCVRERALGVHSIVNIRWKIRSSLTIREISTHIQILRAVVLINFWPF